MKRSRHRLALREDSTDLNYLFFRQQVERSRAETARCDAARKAHEEFARRYEVQIEQLTAESFHFPWGD